ncbi:hypothetical protein SAMN04488123_10231 [Natribacillus halophilus]|uniref:Uncharacterized protein n=1 Tax=Natribacillus halophilus TaxID=549003 RepID=A0A1G8KCW1_9BACI|nr:hypothetical protein SAMN04488123_10231 [Natribacillus halophilus]
MIVSIPGGMIVPGNYFKTPREEYEKIDFPLDKIRVTFVFMT